MRRAAAAARPAPAAHRAPAAPLRRRAPVAAAGGSSGGRAEVRPRRTLVGQGRRRVRGAKGVQQDATPAASAASAAATTEATVEEEVAVREDAGAGPASRAPGGEYAPNVPHAGEQLQEAVDTYQWTKQWYPVCVVAHTDPGKPHHIQILGKDVVFWRDGGGSWRAFEDRCPHRLAPLSEGRIEQDGTLLCAYHAWRFDGDGKCVALPQANNAEHERELCSNQRSCARSFPTAEHHGLLWVWAESGPEAFIESAVLNPPRLSKEYQAIEAGGSNGGGGTDYKVNEWMQRDLPYGWDSFFENAIDPAHACVSHHGLVGSRYTDAVPFQWVPRRPQSKADGFRLALDPAPPPFNVAGKYEASCEYDFQPPVHLRFDWEHPRGYGLAILHYCTPTAPGKCRHFQATVCTADAGGDFNEQPRWFRLNKLSFQPAWWSHIVSPTFLHQDLVLLHSQEKIVEAEEDSWFGACHMPTATDKTVIMFRRWLQRAGGLGWQLPPSARRLPPIERDPERLFDTWNAHTKNCVPCQRALLVTQGIMLASAVGSAAAIAAGDLANGLLLAANCAGFNILRDLFYKYEFSHQANGEDLWNVFARDVLLKEDAG